MSLNEFTATVWQPLTPSIPQPEANGFLDPVAASPTPATDLPKTWMVAVVAAVAVLWAARQ